MEEETRIVEIEEKRQKLRDLQASYEMQKTTNQSTIHINNEKIMRLQNAEDIMGDQWGHAWGRKQSMKNFFQWNLEYSAWKGAMINNIKDEIQVTIAREYENYETSLEGIDDEIKEQIKSVKNQNQQLEDQLSCINLQIATVATQLSVMC